MKQAGKEYIKSLSSQVLAELKQQHISPPFNSLGKARVHDTSTDGWAVQIGLFRGLQCSVEIWFDKFTAHQNRKIYYGVYGLQPDGIKKIIGLAKPSLGNHISISISHWSDSDGIVQLKRPLTKKEFGKPIRESYPEQREYLYGIYEYENLGLQKNETKRLISRIIEFIITINDSLATNKLKENTEVYKASENRQAVQRHLHRERKSHLVVMRKQLDNYICQICKFDYTKKYGSLGEDFAEAHHIVPLAKNDKQRTTTINDLITVCANCHRMLHRMKGEAGDIAKLKKIVKQNKQHR